MKNSLDLNCRGEVLRTLTKLQTKLKRCGPIVRTNAHTHSRIRHKAGHMKRPTCSQESDGGSRKARRLMHLMSGALKIHSSQSACRGAMEPQQIPRVLQDIASVQGTGSNMVIWRTDTY